MEMEGELGHVWYYAQYVQRDEGGQKRALMQLLRDAFPPSYSLNI